MRWIVVSLLLLLVTACSDPALPQNGDASTFEPSRVLDRGTPLGPGNDAGIDPTRMGETPVSIDTRLQYQESKSGELNTVSCDVVDAQGEQIIDLTPVVYVEPDRNIQRTVGGLIGSTPGSYSVFCALPAYGVVDDSPSTWIVTPGVAVELESEVSPQEVAAGEILSVECHGIDEYGNRVDIEDAQYVVAPQDTGSEVGENGDIRITASGVYQVGCRKAGLGESLAQVNVNPGALHDVQVSLSPNRVAYRVDELIEVQWTAEDEFGNAIDNGISFELGLPQSGQAVGASRFRIGLPGRYVIGVTLSDGSLEINRNIEVLIDDGAPTITCVSPTFGEQIVASEGERVSVTAQVSDELQIVSVFVDEQPVSVGSDGRFTVEVPAAFGPNALKITAEDAIGERTSRLCGFAAAASYLPSGDPVSAALRLHLDDEALDEDSEQPAFGSLGDVVRAFLNSEGLYEAIDDGLLAANPIVPEACRIPEVFGRCGFSAGMTYRSLRVQGPNEASFEWVAGGISGDFRLTSVSVTGDMTGWALLIGDYVKQLGLETDWISGELSVGISRSSSGRLRVSYVSVDNLTLGEIRRIDPNPNGGFWDSIVDRFEDGVVAVTDYFFRDMIVDYVADTVETEAAAYLDDLVSSLGTTGIGGAFMLPNLDGQGAIDLTWQTAVDGLDIESGGMLLSANSRLSTQSVARRAQKGVPVPSVEPRSYRAGRNGTGAVIDFTLFNHALTVLWESGYLDIDSDVVEFLGGVDLLGTSLSAQLAAPPSVSGTADGKLQIGLGPLEGRGSIPLIGLGEVVFRAAAIVETEIVVEDWQTLSLRNVEVSQLALALDGVPIGASGMSDFERGVSELLSSVINSTLTSFLPSIPIPAFVMPPEYGRFGVPGNTRLGVLSGGLDIGVRDLEVDGTFGEITP